jgi:hypothetical protein
MSARVKSRNSLGNNDLKSDLAGRRVLKKPHLIGMKRPEQIEFPGKDFLVLENIIAFVTS